MKENIGRQTAIMRMAEVGITPEKVQQGESEFDDIELGC